MEMLSNSKNDKDMKAKNKTEQMALDYMEYLKKKFENISDEDLAYALEEMFI